MLRRAALAAIRRDTQRPIISTAAALTATTIRAAAPAPCCFAAAQRRPFASQAKEPVQVFDRAVKQAQRSRAANAPNSDFYGYLRAEIASRLVDRLADINKAFPVTAEIGCGSGAFVSKLLHTITTPQSHAASDALAAAAAAANPDAARAAAASAAAAAAASATSSSSASEAPYISPPIAPPTVSVPSRGAIRVLHLCDSNPDVLRRTQQYWAVHSAAIPEGREHQYHVVDEEGALPFAPASLDLIVSNLDMHWVNDLPGFMKRCRQALKPDGVFLASMMGGSTLQELRSSFTVADMERLGGIQAHVSPFAYGRDCGDLMAAAGFSMPTVDTDVLTMRYPDLFTLLDHLQGMGENNAVRLRPNAVSRDVFLAAAATYESLYADDDGLLPATFQVFYMIGWAPHASQPKPKERGSATTKIGEIERIASEQKMKAADTTAATKTGCSKESESDAGANFVERDSSSSRS